MKAGWQSKSLEEVCQFSNGLWKGEKPPFVNVGVIRNTNFTKEGALDDSDIAYLDVEAKKFEKRKLQFGDIILEKSGGGPKQPVGRVVLFDKTEGDFSFSNFTAALRVLDARELDFKFLHKFLFWTHLSGVTEGMQSHSTGIRNLDGDAYKAIRISFPLLSEQQRIVGILDAAFDGIATAKATAEQNLQNARALFESHLQSVFTQRGEGWVDATLADVLEVLRNGLNCKQDKSGKGSKISRIESIWNAEFDLTRVGYAEISEAQKERFLLQRGDVLFSHINSAVHVGKTAIFKSDEEVIHGVNLLLMRPSPSILAAYLDLYLKHIFAAGYWLRVCKQSINQASVNQQDINRVPIRFPTIKRQREIVEQMDSLREETQRLASLYQRKLAALDELKKSLLHQAFAGEL